MRKPEVLMRLDRLGSMHQTRLSFARGLLRRLVSENWSFQKSAWNIDEQGVGYAIYSAQKKDEAYTLVAFSHKIPNSMRTDRVIATVWDATFVLVHGGKPTDETISRLSENVPLQEMGRYSANEISLSRANRSVRLWGHVLEKLATGAQPDINQIKQVGYLMRTSAVYGSGKFGCADRYQFDGQTLFNMPFYPEMLSVYLSREFAVDLIEHLAKCQGGNQATTLDSNIKKMLGIGNSTGLGMAPFLLNHPRLLHSWIQARENALAEVLAIAKIDTQKLELLQNLVARSLNNCAQWFTQHPLQQQKLTDLTADLQAVAHKLEQVGSNQISSLTLQRWASDQLHLEGQELVTSLLLELYPEKVDQYTAAMSADEAMLFPIDSSLQVDAVQAIINANFAWVNRYDFTNQKEYQLFWYVSEEKLEPRLGNRFTEVGAELEMPFGIAKAVQDLSQDLAAQAPHTSLAEFMMDFPQHRHTLRRVCMNAQLPYSEIQDNLLAENTLPLDLLRCKLSFLGADQYDPRSDRWVRISLFQRAPCMDELMTQYDDLWIYADA